VPGVDIDQGISPPSFLGLAGHPVRWRLLAQLAYSDRRVVELCSLLGEPQSLVSYHLARLRTDGVVFGRRSAADGRDTYYVLDLDRCGELLAAAGAAVHPGLRLERPALRRVSGRGLRVLFLCTGNSARSQIAEALTQHLSGGAVDAASAGSAPKPLHPNAVRVLAERGIDIADRSSKHIDVFSGCRFGFVVSLCDRVREVCPEFPNRPDLVHWSIPDPSSDGRYTAFQQTLVEIETRVGFLLRLIDARDGTRP
jgi:ArsR family transcriptional regulator, arsenate/arsenite/antimonite-responsive transcriptional repressor / arsenate reductase (thioredoxin)